MHSIKILITVIKKNRLQKLTDHIISEYQAGFRIGKSTTDQIFIVKNLFERAWKDNIAIHQIFIDYQGAYASIQREREKHC